MMQVQVEIIASVFAGFSLGACYVLFCKIRASSILFTIAIARMDLTGVDWTVARMGLDETKFRKSPFRSVRRINELRLESVRIRRRLSRARSSLGADLFDGIK